jgi:hypothetical protein
MNPCRCGRANDPGFACKRGPNTRCVAEYQGRLSGPLLDRIDLHIEVPAVTAADLILPPPSGGSREVAARVARARDIQVERYAALGLENVRTNAQALGPVLEEIARADGTGLALLRDAADSMRLSARGYHRCCASPARWPISTAPKKSAACIWPRRCLTARSPTKCGARRNYAVAIPIASKPGVSRVHRYHPLYDLFTTFPRARRPRATGNEIARFRVPNARLIGGAETWNRALQSRNSNANARGTRRRWCCSAAPSCPPWRWPPAGSAS